MQKSGDCSIWDESQLEHNVSVSKRAVRPPVPCTSHFTWPRERRTTGWRFEQNIRQLLAAGPPLDEVARMLACRRLSRPVALPGQLARCIPLWLAPIDEAHRAASGWRS